MPANADRADHAGNARVINTGLAQAFLEAGALGGAADHADMRDVGIAQRRIGDCEIKRVAVRHDESQRARRCRADDGQRIAGDQGRVGGRRSRKGFRPRIGPGDVKRQWRQGQYGGAADVTGTEDQNGAARVRRNAQSRQDRRCGRQLRTDLPLRAPQIPLQREAAAIESFNGQFHPAAAALAEIRAERLIDEPRRGGPCRAWPGPWPTPSIPACRRRWCRGSPAA